MHSIRDISRRYSLRDMLPYVVNHASETIKQVVCTCLARAAAKWWGIKLGKSSKFYGMSIMRRHPTGRIIIGDNAVFRSAKWANTVGLNRPCFLSVSRDASIVIGDNGGFSGTVIAAVSSIRIGDRVLCGANCTIVDSDCHPLDATARANKEPAEAAPIVIEDDVWLGMNVVVLKGCRIGAKTVVAANSVVTHSLPGSVLAAGVPASVRREGMLVRVEA